MVGVPHRHLLPPLDTVLGVGVWGLWCGLARPPVAAAVGACVGVRVLGFGFGVLICGLGFEVLGVGFRVWAQPLPPLSGAGLRVARLVVGLGFGVWGLGFGVWGRGLGLGFGFGVWG